MPDKGILDLTRLEEAFEDDRAGIAELLEMALDTGAKHRASMEDALASGDAPALAKAAHGIKGSAGNIGALEVAALATELEQRARGGDVSGARERVDAIGAAYDRLADEVRLYKDAV